MRNEPRQIVNDRLVNQVEGLNAGDNLNESALDKASADYYEHRRIHPAKNRQFNWWIAVGLYLLLTSIAFTIL
jgi:hypothetical protein